MIANLLLVTDMSKTFNQVINLKLNLKVQMTFLETFTEIFNSLKIESSKLHSRASLKLSGKTKMDILTDSIVGSNT